MRLTKPDRKALLYIVDNLRTADREELNALTFYPDRAEVLADEVASWGPFAFVGWHDGRPVGAAGATEMWPGVWSFWMFGTDDIPKVGLEMTRLIKRRIFPLLFDLGMHRGEARSIHSHQWAHRWLKTLGFNYEATLRGFGKNGEDFLVFTLHRSDGSNHVPQ